MSMAGVKYIKGVHREPVLSSFVFLDTTRTTASTGSRTRNRAHVGPTAPG